MAGFGLFGRPSGEERPLLALRDLLLPRVCLACGSGLEAGRARSLCGGCLEAFELLSLEGVPLCPSCGLPAPEGPCVECLTRPPAFAASASFGRHQGPLREAVLRLKFAPEPALSRPLGILVARAARRLPRAELVVGVPLAGPRLRERGFNQAATLAREAARALALPFQRGVLTRSGTAAPQRQGGRLERQANVREAFTASPTVEGRSLLLVDDVLTTGATAEACTRALLAVGARAVYVATVTRALPASVGVPPPFGLPQGEPPLHPPQGRSRV